MKTKLLLVFFLFFSSLSFSQEKSSIMISFEENYFNQIPSRMMMTWEKSYYSNLPSRSFFQIILKQSAKWEFLQAINISEKEKKFFMLEFENLLSYAKDPRVILIARNILKDFLISNPKNLQNFFQNCFEKRTKRKLVFKFRIFNLIQ